MSMILALALAVEPVEPAPASPPSAVPVVEQKPVYGPPAPRKVKPKPSLVATAEAAKQCADARQQIEGTTTILVCGNPSEQYRLDRDVLKAEEARVAARRGGAARQQIPGAMPDTGICERSGGCRALEAVNWIGVALVAAQMLDKAIKGENVGQMFVTNPQKSEYDFYKAAKAKREADAEEKDADAAAKRAREAKAAKAVSAGAASAPQH